MLYNSPGTHNHKRKQMEIISSCWSLGVTLPSVTGTWRTFPQKEGLDKMTETQLGHLEPSQMHHFHIAQKWTENNFHWHFKMCVMWSLKSHILYIFVWWKCWYFIWNQILNYKYNIWACQQYQIVQRFIKLKICISVLMITSFSPQR